MEKTTPKPAPETPSSKPLDKTIKFITILFREGLLEAHCKGQR